MSRFCTSIRFLFFFSCSIHCKEDLSEARHWCWWLPEDLWWPPEEWLPPTTLLQEQRCHFTQHPAAAAEDGHHWCRSQGVIELLYPFLLLISNNFFLAVEVCLSGVVLQWKAHHLPGKAWSGPSGWKGCCWSLSTVSPSVSVEMATLYLHFGLGFLS